MATVAHGLQSGEKLMELFGGQRKKKVFIFLSKGTNHTIILP